MIEIFARLNAKTATFTSSGNMPLLDVTDLCGVLASLGEQHSWYVYSLIDQRRSYNMDLLHKYCQQRVMQEMRSRKFKSTKCQIVDIAYGVTKATIFYHFNAKGGCRKCNGLGFKDSKKCDQCAGKGVYEYGWADKVMYGFPMRPDLSRQWYRKVCSHYDNFVNSILFDIQRELIEALSRIKKQAVIYKRENESLFDEP